MKSNSQSIHEEAAVCGVRIINLNSCDRRCDLKASECMKLYDRRGLGPHWGSLQRSRRPLTGERGVTTPLPFGPRQCSSKTTIAHPSDRGWLGRVVVRTSDL